jgi:hypothetical protein
VEELIAPPPQGLQRGKLRMKISRKAAKAQRLRQYNRSPEILRGEMNTAPKFSGVKFTQMTEGGSGIGAKDAKKTAKKILRKRSLIEVRSIYPGGCSPGSFRGSGLKRIQPKLERSGGLRTVAIRVSITDIQIPPYADR